MRLIEALQHVRAMTRRSAEERQVALACGFTPLHLQTFLTAHLAALAPTSRYQIGSGLFGDALGNVAKLAEQRLDSAAVVMEWSDLDPRLGLRALGGWQPSDLADMVTTTAERLRRFGQSLIDASTTFPIALTLPTLPLPPVSYTPGWLASDFELDLRDRLSSFACMLGAVPGVRIVNWQRLDRISPPGERLDVSAEMLSGFPYTLAHASAVGEALARLIAPPSPKKGLITDLDDTLWRGILGEVGVTGVTWDLDHHSQAHAIYQQLLGSLAEAGVLVAIASKNEAPIVDEALARQDLRLNVARVFPREVHWQAKSGSVARILQAWNIGADAVVFVDDSPLELAEVKSAFPEVECLTFPTHDDGAIYELLLRLRDLFGKSSLSREDSLRLDSLKAAAEARREAASAGPGVDPDQLLETAEPVLALSFDREPFDPRALELVNKTNQFNLNGRRYTEGEWRAYLAGPANFLLRVAYEDKFGPLGTIAILGGRVERGVAYLDVWVMSCRAFSRRIEFCSLAAVFDRFAVDAVVLAYQEAPRNQPTRDALASLSETRPAPGLRLDRASFNRRCPKLPHRLMSWTSA